MNRPSALWLLLGFAPLASQAAPYLAKAGYVRFYSSTAMENVEGVSTTAVSTLDLDSAKVAIKARNTTFAFPNKLMQEHFNENYMESAKFPVSSFSGRILRLDRAALDSGRTIPVTIEGVLEVHGVKKAYSTPGYLKKNPDGSIQGETKFPVKVADHGIQVPTIVMAKIAEEMEITARFTWTAPEASK